MNNQEKIFYLPSSSQKSWISHWVVPNQAYIQRILIPYVHYELFTCTIEQDMQVRLEQLYTGSDIQETEDHAIMGFENGIN